MNVMTCHVTSLSSVYDRFLNFSNNGNTIRCCSTPSEYHWALVLFPWRGVFHFTSCIISLIHVYLLPFFALRLSITFTNAYECLPTLVTHRVNPLSMLKT